MENSYTKMKTIESTTSEECKTQTDESQCNVDETSSDNSSILMVGDLYEQNIVNDDIYFDRKEAEHYKVYNTRWYILTIYAVVGIWQNLVYSTFAPIAQSAGPALGLTQTDIALLPNWYNIAYLISAFPFVYLVEVKGMRMPMTATMAFCSIGAAVRCLHTHYKDFDKVFLHLGQLINGFGAAVPWFACTTISAVWFPPGQRNLATAIGLFAPNLGVAFAFLIGPGFINAYKGDGTPEEVYEAIYKLFYFECVISNALLFLTVFYFPSRPPTPPSFTASSARVSYKKGFRDFSKNPWAWLMFTIYVLNTINNTWNQFVSLIVQDVMSELEVGWLGFTMTATPIILAPFVAAALALPSLEPKARLISIVMVVTACGFIALFTIASCIPSQNYLLTKELVWGTVVPAITLSTVPQPIWWEMACDASYPIPESIVSGIYSVGSCTLSMIFLLILMIETLGYMWINWVFLIFQVSIVPLLLTYRHQGLRTAADNEQLTCSRNSQVNISNNRNQYGTIAQ